MANSDFDLNTLGAEMYEFNTEDPTSEKDLRFDPDDFDDVSEWNKDLLDVDEELQARVSRMLDRSVRHYIETLEADQVDATNYYYGREFGDEVEGRSKVVMTPVRDAVQQTLPSLMRIFWGAQDKLEFIARRPDQVAFAKLATKYINYVVKELNPGFTIQYGLFKDSLVRRTGYVKWYNEQQTKQYVMQFSGLNEDDVMFLMQDPNNEVDILDVIEDPLVGDLFEVEVVETRTENIARYVHVPPDEFFTSPNPRDDIDEIPCVAHIRYVPGSDLVEMGIPVEIVQSVQERGRRFSLEQANALDAARQRHEGNTRGLWEDDVDESMMPVRFAEAFILVDTDGDGVAERRKFWCVGDDFLIVNGMGERVDMVPFAVFPMDPEPHTLDSLGFYDYLKDVQRVQSQLMRSTLNSLALALEQKQEVVDGMVNIGDLLEPKIGGFVRVKKPGMMREITHSFLGPEIMAVNEEWKSITEDRTGRSKAALGLDADSLQSSTKQAVAGTLSRAQQQTELIARIFAEVGMKRLYKGLLRTIVRHQNKPRMVRLMGEFVEIDPSKWDIDMDVEVKVAIGAGSDEEQVMFLTGLLQKQLELMQVGSPIVTMVEIRNTLHRITELGGFPNSEEFFKRWTEQEQRMMQQAMAQQPPQPSVEERFVQVEESKVQAKHASDMATLEFEREKFFAEMDMKRDELARMFALKEAELSLKYQQLEATTLTARVTADRALQDGEDNAVQTAFDIAAQQAEIALRAEQNAIQAEGQQMAHDERMQAMRQNRGGGEE